MHLKACLISLICHTWIGYNSYQRLQDKQWQTDAKLTCKKISFNTLKVKAKHRTHFNDLSPPFNTNISCICMLVIFSMFLCSWILIKHFVCLFVCNTCILQTCFKIRQVIIDSYHTNYCQIMTNVITNNSSTVVSHFSKLIFLIAHFSLRGLQSATWTTAVAPDPVIKRLFESHTCDQANCILLQCITLHLLVFRWCRERLHIKTVGVIFSVVHTGISCTTMLSLVCVHVVSHLTATGKMTTADDSGKSAYYSRHPKWSQNWLMSVELVLLCMFQTILLMGNCSWLSSGTEYWISRKWTQAELAAEKCTSTHNMWYVSVRHTEDDKKQTSTALQSQYKMKE